jgi:hypothetical protein
MDMRKTQRLADATQEELQDLCSKMTLAEVGQVFGVSRQRVHKKAKRLGVNLLSPSKSRALHNHDRGIPFDTPGVVGASTANDDTSSVCVALGGVSVVIDRCDGDLVDYKWRRTGLYFDLRYERNKKMYIVWLHHVVLGRKLGRVLSDHEMPDHIDRNPTNNSRSNLRLASASDNACNRGLTKANSSGFKGVSFNNQRQGWVAQITKNRKRHYLGVFDTPEEAAEVYNNAAKELHREFAVLNE